MNLKDNLNESGEKLKKSLFSFDSLQVVFKMKITVKYPSQQNYHYQLCIIQVRQ